MDAASQKICDEVIEAFLEILHLKEKELEGHNRRVAQLAVRLGQQIGLSKREILDLQRGALLHDIGKICIPDAILNKTGEFTLEEYEVMKKHTVFGASILRHISCLENAFVVAESHHEKWDGSGYPYGLCGEKIPLFARISSIAGVYDALTSQRSYKPALSKKATLHFISEHSGISFDPAMVSAFLGIMKDDLD